MRRRELHHILEFFDACHGGAEGFTYHMSDFMNTQRITHAKEQGISKAWKHAQTVSAQRKIREKKKQTSRIEQLQPWASEELPAR